MIIWSGFGFLVGVISFGSLLLTEMLVEYVYQNDNYYQSHGWPKLVGFVVAAGVVWVVGQLLQNKPRRVLIDPETGEKVAVGGDHSFFFIPVKYWPPILLVIGFVFSFLID